MAGTCDATSAPESRDIKILKIGLKPREPTSQRKQIRQYTATYQNFKYNFTYFKDHHVISAICYTMYSKVSLFNSIKIAVIKHKVDLKGNHIIMRLNHVRLQNFLWNTKQRMVWYLSEFEI